MKISLMKIGRSMLRLRRDQETRRRTAQAAQRRQDAAISAAVEPEGLLRPLDYGHGTEVRG